MKSNYENQPKEILNGYIAYVEGMISITEIPFYFHEWANMEMLDNSPIGIIMKQNILGQQ